VPVILPPTATLPLDTVDTVLNFSRARINDAIQGISGNLLADTQPYTFTLLNAAFRHLQEDLANAGNPAFTNETVLFGLPVVALNDPSVQVWMSCQYYFDGVSFYTAPEAPLLPFDCILPLRLWERQSGTQNQFTDMNPVNDGLPDNVKTNWLGLWDWRGNAIYMPGALIERDVRIRYASYLADIASSGTALVPLIRSADALAHYVAAEFCNSRGTAEDAAVGSTFAAKGMAAMKRMTNRDARREQRGNHRRQGYSNGRHSGWGTM
jgi:hypothetical protein